VTVTPATNGAPLQSVVVNYGDGSSDDLGAISGTVAVQHIYASAGSYTPGITATDTAGGSATASTVIVVQSMLVTITATPVSGSPMTFSFKADIIPAGPAAASYTWSFGDGATSTTSSPSTSHTYSTSGDKTVRVTVRTTTNQTATGSTTITVP
jgi:immune inhibitor A